MKKIQIGIMLLTTISFNFFSCKNDQTGDVVQNNDTNEQNVAKLVDSDTARNEQFLVSAAELNMKEIELGQLAEKNGNNPQVKNLGKTLVQYHKKMQEELKSLSEKKNVKLPMAANEDTMDDTKKLNDKAGSDFDKEYCDMIVDEHKEAIDKFEKISTDSKDMDIREWATTSLKDLREHLDKALKVQEAVTQNSGAEAMSSAK